MLMLDGKGWQGRGISEHLDQKSTGTPESKKPAIGGFF